MNKIFKVASVAALSTLNTAYADDIRLSGFGTVNATYNPFDSQYMELREGFTSDGTKLGFVFNANMNEKLSFSSQVLYKQSPIGRGTELRWANLSYDVASDVKAKIGRMPLTDRAIGDINYSNIWNNEPGEYFYQLIVRSFDGVQLAYEKQLGGGLRLEVEANLGQTGTSVKLDGFIPGVEADIHADNFIGLMGTLRTSSSKVMLSASTTEVSVSVDETSQANILKAIKSGVTVDPALLPEGSERANNFFLSYQQDFMDDWMFYGGVTYANTKHPALNEQVGAFASLTRYFNDVSLHYTYALQRENVEGGQGWIDSQRSHKLGLTYDVNYSSNIRAEITALSNDTAINDNFVMRIPPESGVMASVAYNFVF